MRKVLLTVMMVSSLLAFNACKKDGAQGPAGPAGAQGPAGPAGPAGAAGAVGPAGAKGADGTKILKGTVDPTAADGAVGDYYFNATSKTLWGPKVAAGWAGTSVSLVGATGAAGANGTNGTDGKDGSSFLAGAGAPTAATGKTGDFYFDTTSSTFYGPKLADGTWGSTVLPLGSAFAAKTYTITRGFEDVTEVANSRVYGFEFDQTYTKYEIFTSYAITANDMIRINQYPGWGTNREMIFETTPGSGVFDRVPTGSADFGTAAGQIFVGAKFRYSHNTTNPTAEFTLTADDVARLSVNNGASFGYLTYAKADPATVALGQNLVLARAKNVQVKNSTSNFYTTYTANTKFNINTLVPNYEKYRQDGKVWVKYKYYTQNSTTAASNNVLVNHSTPNAGWIDLTSYANSYLPGTGYDLNPGINPFTLDAAANNFMGSGFALGVLGTAVTVGPSQVATVVAGAGTTVTSFVKGNVRINWTIVSGTNAVTTRDFGPTQLSNAASVADPVTAAANNPALFVPRAFATDYYSAAISATAPSLTFTNNAGAALQVGVGASPAYQTAAGANTVTFPDRKDGKEASYFTGTKLVQIQVLALPGEVVNALRAKGVNVDDLNEVSKFVKL